jgi:hypothetical protein
MPPWRPVRIVALVVLAFLVEPAVMADEIVATTDGRKLLLRSDGTFEFLSRLEPAVIDRALATAHEWAQDQTLIAYCFRTSPERELMTRNFASDRDEGLSRLRRAGATEQQLRQVATTIVENYRLASPR